MNESQLRPKVTMTPATKQVVRGDRQERNLKVAAYCRVSTLQDEQEHSFEVQKQYYTEKIAENPAWKMAGIYADEDITGTSMKNRENLKRMLWACREGRIDLILVKSVSRFGRNTVDVMETVRSLQERGIGVIFEKEGLDTRNMNSELMLAFHSAFSQSESKSIRENVSWGFRKSFERGKVHISGTMFGFRRLENGEIAVDEEQADAVRLMFDLYLGGMSTGQIKKELEARGIKTALGNDTWNARNILLILQNEKYKGDALLQKTYRPTLFSKRVGNDGVLPKYYVTDCLPQIVSKEIFDRAQAEISKRQAKCVASSTNKSPFQGKHSGKYALLNLLLCANCGAPYRRVTWNIRGKKKVVGRCASRLEHGKTICKDSPTIEEAALHTAIMQAIQENYVDADLALETTEKNLARILSPDFNGDEFAIRSRLRELKEQRAQLVQKCLDDGDDGRYDLQFTNIVNEMENLNQRLAGIEEAAQNKKLSDSRMGEIRELLERFNGTDMEFDNDLVYCIVREIRVGTNRQIEIVFQDDIEIITAV